MTFASDIRDMTGIIIPIAGLLFAAFCVLISAVKSVAITRARERTKREVAAYMAEGTITSEDAERILRRDEKARCG